VGAGDFAGQAQAEAGTVNAPVARLVRAVEAFEQPLALPFGNARPGVRDRQRSLTRSCVQRQLDVE